MEDRIDPIVRLYSFDMCCLSVGFQIVAKPLTPCLFFISRGFEFVISTANNLCLTIGPKSLVASSLHNLFDHRVIDHAIVVHNLSLISYDRIIRGFSFNKILVLIFGLLPSFFLKRISP